MPLSITRLLLLLSLLETDRDFRLDLLAVAVENESDDQDQRDNEEPDELSSNTFVLLFAEIASPALAAHAPAIAAVASVLAHATTSLFLLLHLSEDLCRGEVLHHSEVGTLVNLLLFGQLLNELKHAVGASEARREAELLSVEARAATAGEPAIEIG